MIGAIHGYRQRGFTLLELLVALAVFAIMAVAAYSGLQSVLTTQAVVEAKAQRLARLQMAFHFLAQDLEQATPRSIRDEYGQPQPALKSGAFDGELVTLTRAGWDNPLAQARATLQRLSYRFRGGRLLRSYWQTLDRSGAGEPRETLLLDAIQSASIRFLDDRDEWQSEWPSTGAEQSSPALPRALEISLVLADWGEITRLFRLPAL